MAQAQLEVEINLIQQAAFLLQDGRVIAETPISSGRASHPTPAGNFVVVQKDLDHRSTLYGRVVDAEGKVVVRDADLTTPVPEGGKFVQAPMRHFMRFNGAVGMHAGRLPGYAASHGCVRLPPHMASYFYKSVPVGTPVHVVGRAPSGHVAKHRTSAMAVAVKPPAPPPRRNWFSRLFHQEPPAPARGGFVRRH